MATPGSISEARIQGELAAARELRRLHVDQSQAVDVYNIIASEQLWLIFRPLEDALGSYLPGGILVNAERRPALQRLTAAHEYGHHVLGHKSSVDVEEDIGDPKRITKVNEASAQAFAVNFLMPVQLVNALWQRLSVPDKIEPYHAYALSLHLGTSYQATVCQLAAQERLRPAEAQGLLSVQPKSIKQRIGHGAGPQNPWADTWPVGRKQSGTTIWVAVDDEICIDLPESPSTGYVWSVGSDSVLDLSTACDGLADYGTALGLIRTEFGAPDGHKPLECTGGFGMRRIALRALRPGDAELRASLVRPWLGPATAVDEFVLAVRVAEIMDGLPRNVQKVMVAA